MSRDCGAELTDASMHSLRISTILPVSLGHDVYMLIMTLNCPMDVIPGWRKWGLTMFLAVEAEARHAKHLGPPKL